MKKPCRFQMEKKCPTLSGRLIVLFVVMTALIVVSVGSAVMWAFRGHFEASIQPHLVQYLEYIQADIGTPPDKDKAQQLANRLGVQIHYINEQQNWSTNSQQNLGLPQFEYSHEFRTDGINYGFGHSHDQEYLVSHYPNFTLAFSIPHKKWGGWAKLIPIVISILALGLLFFATRRLFSPISIIKEGVEYIGAGNLKHRIHIERQDELGDLGHSINHMAEDIEQMLEAKRQLLLAISHELRSPLTRAKVSLALLDNEEQQNEIRRDLNEMEALIEELLETERLSTRHHSLLKTSVDIEQLIPHLINEHFASQRIDLRLPSEAISLELDQARIKLLLKNILDNAIKHNPKNAQPSHVTVSYTAQLLEIIICDHGPGIEAEHLPHLTEPFYRTDAARQRQTGGYGLGLYLCRVITEAHGGELKIESVLGEGTCVRIKLPRA